MAFGSGGHGATPFGATRILIVVVSMTHIVPLEFIVDNEELILDIEGTELVFVVDDEDLVFDV